MKLAIDIGNTQTKLGLFNDLELIHSDYFNDNKKIKEKLYNIKKLKPTSAIISSVVPDLTKKYKQLILETLSIDSFIINNKNCNVNLKVQQPATVGADRMCNVMATIKLYNTPLISTIIFLPSNRLRAMLTDIFTILSLNLLIIYLIVSSTH